MSDEASAASPAFEKSKLAFISGSATKTSLTTGDDRLPTFFRTVATDYAQSQTDADFIRKTLKATKVWIVDDGGTYSHPIADRVERLLDIAGLDVTRDSASQTSSDFSALVAKAPPGVQVVFLPWQVGSRAAAFYNEFRKQGKTATFVGTDKLDGQDWLGAAEGQYLSSFADVKLLPSKYVSNVVSGYTSRYGDFKSTFGPPTFVATQVAAAGHSRRVHGRQGDPGRGAREGAEDLPPDDDPRLRDPLSRERRLGEGEVLRLQGRRREAQARPVVWDI